MEPLPKSFLSCDEAYLIEKKKINARYYKRYDKPLTPYRRLM
jgi:hypothetical protein